MRRDNVVLAAQIWTMWQDAGTTVATVAALGVLMVAASVVLVTGALTLASKYLHFHVPALFFLYDSRADRMLTRLSPIRRRSSVLRAFGGDLAYTRFVSYAMALRQQLSAQYGVTLSPRQLDRLLLNLDARAVA